MLRREMEKRQGSLGLQGRLRFSRASSGKAVESLAENDGEHGADTSTE